MEINTQNIFIASYPRSGNTYLRTILYHCFGLRSASVYQDELENNNLLKANVGHIEPKNNIIDFGNQTIRLIKTHEMNLKYLSLSNDIKAFYIIRDARAVCNSLYNFYNKKTPLEQIILGNTRFGKWSDHVQSWGKENSGNILVITYESLLYSLNPSLKIISNFLNVKLLNTKIPNRAEIADGKYIRKSSNWKVNMPQESIKLCNEINKEMLKYYGYM